MLWLCLTPQRLALDAVIPADQAGITMTARHGSRRWVVASRDGVFAGADAGAVMAARPELTLRDHDPDAERSALQDLAALAHQLGAPVHVDYQLPSPDVPAGRSAVCVEVGASRRLFGGIDGVITAARDSLATQPLHCTLAVAPTLEGAALAARHADGLILQNAAALRAWLPELALHGCALPARSRDRLQAAGIRTLGQLLEIPRDQLTRRFGAALPLQLDRLTGHAPDPKPAHRLPRQFLRRQRFDGVVHHVEGLLFPLRRLFGALALDLRARDCGARQVTLQLEHEDGPDTVMQVRLTAPAREATHWLMMARERLSRLALPAPVQAMRLHCDAFDTMEAPQMTLFDSDRSDTAAWQQTIERVMARLGEDTVWQPAVAADHRPERAWMRLPPDAPAAPSQAPNGERPMWLLDPPRPLNRPPRLAGEPERIAAGWWDGEDAVRDYYIAEGRDGARLWVYRDLENARWFLHGLWA